LKPSFTRLRASPSAVALITLPFLEDVDLSVQPVDDGIVGKRCSEEQ
jgi:hypothetical protein